MCVFVMHETNNVHVSYDSVVDFIASYSQNQSVTLNLFI